MDKNNSGNFRKFPLHFLPWWLCHKNKQGRARHVGGNQTRNTNEHTRIVVVLPRNYPTGIGWIISGTTTNASRLQESTVVWA